MVSERGFRGWCAEASPVAPARGRKRGGRERAAVWLLNRSGGVSGGSESEPNAAGDCWLRLGGGAALQGKPAVGVLHT